MLEQIRKDLFVQLRRRWFLTLLLAVFAPTSLTCALIPPTYFDAVVAIGIKPAMVSYDAQHRPTVSRGNFLPLASGFLYGAFIKKVDEKVNSYSVYFVTNAHVIDGALQSEQKQIEMLKQQNLSTEIPPYTLFLRFNAKDGKPARDDLSLPFKNDQGKDAWHRHSLVDLAIAPIDVTVLDKAGIEYSYFRSDQAMDRAEAKQSGLGEGDGVFALGFPMGLGVSGENRNYVLARQGSIARIRDCLDGSMNEFLTDLFVFPGNSGGPVVVKPDLISIEGTKPQASAKLIGIVREYVPYTDVAISQQTQRPRIFFEENSGLAGIIPIDYLNELTALTSATK